LKANHLTPLDKNGSETENKNVAFYSSGTSNGKVLYKINIEYIENTEYRYVIVINRLSNKLTNHYG